MPWYPPASVRSGRQDSLEAIEEGGVHCRIDAVRFDGSKFGVCRQTKKDEKAKDGILGQFCAKDGFLLERDFI